MIDTEKITNIEEDKTEPPQFLDMIGESTTPKNGHNRNASS